jgi:hypothetical protein
MRAYPSARLRGGIAAVIFDIPALDRPREILAHRICQ